MTFSYISEHNIIREYRGEIKKKCVNSALSPHLLGFVIAISVLVLL